MKTLMIALISCQLILGLFSPVWGEEDIDMRFEGPTFSANFEEIPLMAIRKRLEQEKGIWFKGPDSLFEEKMTVRFTGLSFKEGLNRILATMNYSLVFNKNDELIGVMVISKGKPGSADAKGRDVSLKKTIGQSNQRKTDLGKAFEVRRNVPPPGGPVKVTPEELESFKVKRNVPPPGGPVKITPEERENFKVIKNAPPPGS